MRKRPSQSSGGIKSHNICMNSKASVYHATVIIFLEFFAFGLLTAPMITVLDETFPRHTFLMNGLIQGVKGFLSFLSAPLLGAMSDVFGRKPFLLLTVTFTCSPIPLMKISHWWYFTMVSISGVFAVTFSVVFAYVADVTKEEDRSWAYGLVSATFAASLVISPTIGAYLGKIYSDNFVVALSTAIALLDIFFILACVPESLPESYQMSSSGNKKISWDKADPFGALRRIGNDYLILILCIATFLSFLPEAGQYSCFFVYLRLVLGFTEEFVALFIGFVGIFSCLAQTLFLTFLIKYLGPKNTIMIGLAFEMIQLTIYGFGNRPWMIWLGGGIASLGSITYPAISTFVSKHADTDQQGVAQGVLTGIRGLCNGIGPAMFGFIFYLFQVDLTGQSNLIDTTSASRNQSVQMSLKYISERLLPGPPFAFGAILVLMAILVSTLIPNNPHAFVHISDPSNRKRRINYVAVSSNNVEGASASSSDESNSHYRQIADDDFEENYLKNASKIEFDSHNAFHSSSTDFVDHIDITDRSSTGSFTTESSHQANTTVVKIDTTDSSSHHKMLSSSSGANKSFFPKLSLSKHRNNPLSRGMRYLRMDLGTKQATS